MKSSHYNIGFRPQIAGKINKAINAVYNNSGHLGKCRNCIVEACTTICVREYQQLEFNFSQNILFSAMSALCNGLNCWASV